MLLALHLHYLALRRIQKIQDFQLKNGKKNKVQIKVKKGKRQIKKKGKIKKIENRIEKTNLVAVLMKEEARMILKLKLYLGLIEKKIQQLIQLLVKLKQIHKLELGLLELTK
jgi:hypothetical protein